MCCTSGDGGMCCKIGVCLAIGGTGMCCRVGGMSGNREYVL